MANGQNSESTGNGGGTLGQGGGDPGQGGGTPSYSFLVNKVHKDWPQRLISGKEIKQVAGSPADWIVNQKVSGPGEDPEIGDNQKVDLDKQAEPKGEKQFTTRKPATSPG